MLFTQQNYKNVYLFFFLFLLIKNFLLKNVKYVKEKKKQQKTTNKNWNENNINLNIGIHKNIYFYIVQQNQNKHTCMPQDIHKTGLQNK